ncbi:hypothetical protein PFISCL1PPCAC_24396, partial [Pristionchus fissidentatus]
SMHPLIPRISQADSTCESLEAIREVESSVQFNPQKSEDFSRYLVPLFCSPSSSVRRHAFQSAIHSLSTNPQRQEQIFDGYRLALNHPQIEIASTAIQYLPQMITAAGDQTSILIASALAASKRHLNPFQFTSIIASTMQIVKNRKDEKEEEPNL